MAADRRNHPACRCGQEDGDCPLQAVRAMSAAHVSLLAEELWQTTLTQPPLDPSGWMGQLDAGRDAYDSQRRRQRAVRRHGLLWRVAAMLATGSIGGLLIRAPMGARAALAVGVATAVAVGRWLVVPLPGNATWRRAVTSWRTTRALRAVERAGYLVLREPRRPGSPLPIGHLVIGPTGVWVLESQRWSWRRALQVRWRRRRAPSDPPWHPAWLWRMTAAARSNAHGVAKVIEAAPRLRVRPLLCVHGSVPDAGLSVDGVPVVAAGQLAGVIRRGPLLERQEVISVAARALSVFRPAA